MHAFIPPWTHTHRHPHMHAHTYTHTCMHTHAPLHTHARAHMHIHTCTHMHTHMYAHYSQWIPELRSSDRPTPYLDMAAANSSEFLLLCSEGLLLGLKLYPSFSVHWLVLRMKLQSWGTSSSTWEEGSKQHMKTLHQEHETLPSPELTLQSGHQGNTVGDHWLEGMQSKG